MDFSVDFYKDDVRNGFYIPTAIKQAWAANLSVLSEIDRICEKHGITYYADWGTILGAVRHGGYVPWDDDLDICMKREDYNHFRRIADKELPDEFAIHDFRSKEDHWLFLARVVNCNQMCFEEEHLKKYHNFPYISVVDIFVKDYIYRDEDKAKKHCEEIKKLIAVADGIVDGSFSTETIRRELDNIEKTYSTYIDRDISNKAKAVLIYDIAEQQMARVKEDEADNIGQMFPMVLKGDRGMPKEYYDHVIRLPFENFTIPVPACYDKILRNRYGNYLEIHKIWGGHNYPFFEGQRKNLQAVADFALPEFTFKPEMLEACDKESGKQKSLIRMSKNFVEQYISLNDQLLDLMKNELYDEVQGLLSDAQQFVVDYGTLIENVKGDSVKGVVETVSAIQNYCDALYAVYLLINSNQNPNKSNLVMAVNKLAEACQFVLAAINDNIINKKVILFLPLGGKEWNVFDSIYREYKNRDDCDIYVVPVPVFFKDIYGRVEASDQELKDSLDYSGYPDDIVFSSWMDYDVGLHRPDVIYIQNPYDGENPCLTIPSQFYSVNIRQYTDRLVYIPPFITGEFGENDYNDIYNMKHYVTAPGLMYADEIIVQSENIKKRYIEKLTEFAGVDTKYIWERKILIGGCRDIISYETGFGGINNKKKILYCLGLNELSEHPDDLTDKVQRKMKVFYDNNGDISVDILLFPGDVNIWNNTDMKLTEDILRLFKRAEAKGWCHICNADMDAYEQMVYKYDAYYGSASPLVPIFACAKKPVMIACYDVL